MRNPADLARPFADSMNSHGADRFTELVSENDANHNPSIDTGRPGPIRLTGQWPDNLSDTRVVVDEAFADGGRVVKNLACRKRHTGSFLGVPASGTDVTMRSINIWRFENDRLVEHWDEFNLPEIFQQMGAVPMQDGASQ